MTLLEITIAGLVQGITEFLPVSSSGHLVLLHSMFGFREPTRGFDVLLHFSTLLAVLLFFRKDIIDLFRKGNRRVLAMIAAASIPAVIAGLFFKDGLEALFSDPFRVCVMLLVTGIILFAAHFAGSFRGRKAAGPGFANTFAIGIAQAFALIPGISRSGATISTGIMTGIEAEDAFRFSFLLAVPVIMGATVYEFVFAGVDALTVAHIARFSPGLVIAFLSGLASLFLLRSVVGHKKLHVFGYYCLAAGSIGMFILK